MKGGWWVTCRGGQVKLKGQDVGGGSGWRLGGKNRLWGEMSRQFCAFGHGSFYWKQDQDLLKDTGIFALGTALWAGLVGIICIQLVQVATAKN